jgi:nucleotide-binding universal stress UspA family protein
MFVRSAGTTRFMQTIVVAAKAGASQPWVADAAAELAHQIGAQAKVISVDGVELEALSPLPRSEYQENARRSAEEMAQRIGEKEVPATAEVRSGKVVPGILLYAEEHDADLIVVGASRLGPVARRVLGDVPLELVQRSRRPVLVVSPPGKDG